MPIGVHGVCIWISTSNSFGPDGASDEVGEEGTHSGETRSGSSETRLQGFTVEILREIIAAEVRGATSTASHWPAPSHLNPRQVPWGGTRSRW